MKRVCNIFFKKMELGSIFEYLVWFRFGLRLYVPVNNFSVMLGRSHLFLGITSTFLGGKCILLKDTTQRPEFTSYVCIRVNTSYTITNDPRCY